MSNSNLFRKGLATSAIAALGVSVFTGVAPASATEPAVSLELTHGTSTNVKTWDFAELKAGFSLAANPFAQDGYYTGDSGDTWITADANYSVMPVSYLVESLDGADVYAVAYDGYDDHGDFEPDSTYDYDGDYWNNLYDYSYQDENATADSMVLIGGRYHNVTNRLILDLNNAPSDKASRVKVTSFLDHNGDGQITTGTDESAAPITITFNRPADLSVVTDLAQPMVDDAELNADVTISPVLNDDTSWGADNWSGPWGPDMEVDFTVENSDNENDLNSDNWSTMDYGTNSDGKYTAYESEMYDGNIDIYNVKPGNYEAQAYIYGQAVGNISRKVVAERLFNDVDFNGTESANLNYENEAWWVTSDYVDNGYEYTADFATARQGTQVETYSVTAYGQNGELLPAGSKLNLVVDDTYTYYTNDYEVKVNGSVVEYGDSIELTVGAEGKATFTVQNTVARANGNEIQFLVTGENWVAGHALNIRWEAEYYDITDLNADDYSDENRNIESAGTYTFNFGVSDQWGQAPANGEYRIAAYGYDRVAFDQVVSNVVNGRASLTVTDNGSTEPQARDGIVNVELERHTDIDPLYPYWNYLDGDWEEFNQDADDYNFYFSTYVQGAGYIVSDDTEFSINAAANAFIADRDNRLNRWCGHDDIELYDVAGSNSAIGEYDGYVHNAVTGVIRAGAKVTVTGAGFQFASDTWREKLSQNTFTTYADYDGEFDFNFTSHTKGVHTLTITSGAATTTIKVTVDNLAAANVAVSQVANSQAGKTLVSTATVTDKWGNSVDEGAVTFASNFGTVPVASVNLDDNGVAVGQIEVGANDLGTATVTATANDVVGTATTTFGTTDGHVFKNKKRVTATWEFAKGKTVAIYRDGRRVRNIPVATDDAGKFSFNVKKGKHTVTLKIAGAVVYSYTFNVK